MSYIVSWQMRGCERRPERYTTLSSALNRWTYLHDQVSYLDLIHLSLELDLEHR